MTRGRDDGQVAALVAVCLGFLCVCAIAASVVALEVAARERLQQAASAAALAIVQDSAVRMRLLVRYVRYSCGPSAPVLGCQGVGGWAVVQAGAGAFAAQPQEGFGPLPGWAADAGCVGTVWSGRAPTGSYLICLGQQLTGAVLVLPPDAQALAQGWLTRALAGDGLLRAARIDGVTLGTGARVTVTASAGLVLAWPGADLLRVRVSAWPGAT